MRDPFAPATHADADADGCMSRLAREYPGLGNAAPDEARLWVEEFRSRPRDLCWRALDAMKRELGSSIFPDLAKFRAACQRLSGSGERVAADQRRESQRREWDSWGSDTTGEGDRKRFLHMWDKAPEADRARLRNEAAAAYRNPRLVVADPRKQRWAYGLLSVYVAQLRDRKAGAA